MISWSVSLFALLSSAHEKMMSCSQIKRQMGRPEPTCSLKQKYSTHPNFLREGKTAFSYIFEATFLLWFLRYCMSSQSNFSCQPMTPATFFPFFLVTFNEAGHLALPISPLFQSPLYDCSSGTSDVTSLILPQLPT